MIINFLEADVPLTKTFRPLKGGGIEKDAYPLVARVTSHEENIDTPSELFKAIRFHADLGHCLLKGQLSRPLTNESRRGTTRTDQFTQWVCLDFDRFATPNLDEALTEMGLGDISYVLQYSASHGLDEHMGSVSAHVFMLLDEPTPAPDLKAWLMGLNFKHLAADLRLSNSKTVLSWPLDITTCQNDKLLYISPPRFIKPLKDPLKERITLVPKKLSQLPVSRIGIANINALKTQERTILNTLREAESLPKRTAKTSFVGAVEVQNKPDVCTVTGVKDCGEFVRLNINGGDSWAYWHAKDNFELIHDFKSDTWYKTKEFIPGYYQGLVEERRELNATPTEDGDLILAFRDLKTATYYNGLWNPEEKRLDLYQARNETQLDHWMRSHGRVMGDFIPVWDICFDPHGDWVVDEQEHKINTFRPSPYFMVEPNPDAKFPVIEQVVCHLLGVKNAKDELYQHFINWLAVVFQRKAKPLTSWVLHGVEGTGKGTLFGRILQPLLGGTNVFAARIDNLEENYNGWLQGKLLILVDEVDVDDFREKGRVSSKLRNYITEPMVSFRHMRQTAVFDKNYASFIFASNRPQPVFIPEGDRRYNCGNFQSKKLVYPGDDALESELEKFAAFLLAHKADTEKSNTIMQTEARERIQKLGITSIAETCNSIKNGDFDALWLSMPDEQLMAASGIKNTHTDNAQAYCMLMRRLRDEALVTPKTNISRDEMLIILQYNVGNMPQTPNKFTSLLRHHGIETTQLRRNGMKTMGMAVEWEISDELRKEFGTKPALRKVK
jgi:hypothetical protein